MTWFFAIGIVLLIGAVAVVAAGRSGEMRPVYDDRPDPQVPAHHPVTGQDLRGARFSTAWRGYRMSEVDALLDRLAEQMETQTDDTTTRDPQQSGATAPGQATPASSDADAPQRSPAGPGSVDGVATGEQPR